MGEYIAIRDNNSGIFYKKQDKDILLLNAGGSQETIFGFCHPRIEKFSKVMVASSLLDPLKFVKSQGVYLLDMGSKMQATTTSCGCPIRIARTKSVALVDSKALIAQAWCDGGCKRNLSR